jgi:hypothetical protein
LVWCAVSEAFEAGSIVVVDEAEEEGVALGVGCEQTIGAAALGLAGDGFDDTAVEAFDQAVGLRVEGFCEAVLDLVLGTEAIEGMPSGGPVMGLVSHIDGEAVGELAAIARQELARRRP